MNNNNLTEEIYNPENLVKDFIEIYGGKEEDVKLFSSPARINIIGEHIDYNGGLVFPAAINRYLYCAIRKREDTKIIYNDLHFPGTYIFDVNDNFKYSKENDYANYLNGILSQLKEKGYVFNCGFELLMVSNIPAGGGISSSSALECGFAFAVSELFGFNIDRITIAKLGQMSEHNFMNVNCGIMDQFIIANGKSKNAISLDCATLEYEYVPLELGDFRFVVMNTNKQRKLSDSKYNERRSECEKALEIIKQNWKQIKDLCSLTPEDFEKAKEVLKDDVLVKRCHKICQYLLRLESEGGGVLCRVRRCRIDQ